MKFKNSEGVLSRIIRKELSANLLELLHKKQINQRQLAMRLGISSSTLNRYVKGNSEIPDEITERIARELNVLPQDINPAFGAENLAQFQSAVIKNSPKNKVLQALPDNLTEKQAEKIILLIKTLNAFDVL